MITSLLNTNLIKIGLESNTKEELFAELAQMLLDDNRISDKEEFLSHIHQRESLGVTCTDGFAYPHSKSSAVINPAIAVGVKHEGIDYDSEEGERPTVFFMIASPDNGADHHIYVLQDLFGKFEEELIVAMNKATTKEEILDLLA